MPASFKEFRDLWAAEATRTGLVGLMQRTILRLLNALVAVLAEARARRAAEAAATTPDVVRAGPDIAERPIDVCDWRWKSGGSPVRAILPRLRGMSVAMLGMG